MRDLRKIEVTLAYAMPIAAAAPLLWFPRFIVEQHLRVGLSTKIAAVILAFLVTVVVPILLYAVLGRVAFSAAKRNRATLTCLLWIILFPAWYVSGYLYIIVQFSEGVHAVLYYGAAPLVAIVAALASTASRIQGRRSRRHAVPPDLI